MPDSLLPTKLLIPTTRPELVPRPQLVQQLDAGLHRALTLISAPAGFGKTTLAAEWVSSLHLDRNQETVLRIAWLSLDEADNDVGRFLAYFLTAIIQQGIVNASTGQSVLEMAQPHQPAPLETIFAPLLRELANSAEKIVVVLDDYHLIDDLPVHKVLNFWIESAPPQVHTILITREDPPLPLARLRARDQMTEFRVNDLRFTEAESTQFLNEIMGIKLSAESVSVLEERTEGWIAGLQMAALSMRDRNDLTTFIEKFSGSNRYILDYLLEEVLANQPKEIQQFLLETSILQKLSAPLCDALIEDGQSESTLDYLDHSNLFLIPLDDERSWYRYHHLFSDLLRVRLQQTYPAEEVSALHARAAQWHEKQGMSFGAIYHASLIPDDVWVERIIDQNYMEVFQRRDSVTIRHWTGELGKDLIFRRPQLAIHEANSRAWFGQLDEADRLLDEAEKRLKQKTPTAEIQGMFGYMAYVRARITAMRGDFQRAIDLCIQAQSNTPASNPGLLGGIGVMLGYGYFLDGNFPLAVQVLDETIQSGKSVNAINTTIGAYCVLARLFTIQGRLHKAFDLYQEAEQFLQWSEGEHLGAMSIVDVGFAEIHYEWNQIEAAQDRIVRGLEFIPQWSKADDIALAHILNSKIQQALGNSPAAKKSIEKGLQVIQSSGVFPEARDAVISADVLAKLRHDDSHSINRWASSLAAMLQSENPYQFENELILSTLARVRCARNDPGGGLELLTRLEAHAKSGGRNGRLIGILCLQALAQEDLGESAQASSALKKALALAEPGGYVRIVLDEGEPMRRLLARWASRAEAGTLKEYANYLVSQFEHEPLPKEMGLAGGKLIEPLSPREIEVLTHIASGRTNKEIAQELIISPGTVKAHTSSIYRKLDAANRTEAVARARELDILS